MNTAYSLDTYPAQDDNGLRFAGLGDAAAGALERAMFGLPTQSSQISLKKKTPLWLSIAAKGGAVEKQPVTEVKRSLCAAQAWNMLRRDVLEEAVWERLVPALSGEARARLAGSGREAALADAGDRFWDLATQAPLHVRACTCACYVHCLCVGHASV